jgi:hypothetical protein
VCCKWSKWFWNTHNAVWPFRGEPSSDCAVLTVAMYSVREPASNLVTTIPVWEHLQMLGCGGGGVPFYLLECYVVSDGCKLKECLYLYDVDDGPNVIHCFIVLCFVLS